MASTKASYDARSSKAREPRSRSAWSSAFFSESWRDSIEPFRLSKAPEPSATALRRAGRAALAVPHASSFNRIEIGATMDERMGRKGIG